MSIENPSATEYIQHHMQHLQSLHQQVIVDFSVFNYDTLFFSILSLLVVFFVLRLGAKKLRLVSQAKCSAPLKCSWKWSTTRLRALYMVIAPILLLWR